jgi:hypothetical protein
MTHFEHFPPEPVHPNTMHLDEMLQVFQDVGGSIADSYKLNARLQAPHIAASKHAITVAADMAARIAGSDAPTALILGAGACTDIPLRHIVKTFEQTTVVEMDVDATTIAIDKLLPQTLRPKVRVVQADATGFLQPINEAIERAVDQPEWPGFVDALKSGLDAIEPAQTLPDLGKGYAFVCSHLVMSQLANTPVHYADQLSQTKYGKNLEYVDLEHVEPEDILSANPVLQILHEFATKTHLAHADLLRRSVAASGIVHFADTLFHIEGENYTQLVTARIKDELAARFDTVGQERSWEWRPDTECSYKVWQATLTPKK